MLRTKTASAILQQFSLFAIRSTSSILDYDSLRTLVISCDGVTECYKIM